MKKQKNQPTEQKKKQNATDKLMSFYILLFIFCFWGLYCQAFSSHSFLP